MVQKLTLATVLSSALIFTACGGGGSGGSDNYTPPEVSLELTVGNFTMDSASSISRITTTISANIKTVAKVSINKDGDISINGTDADLFTLNGTGRSRILSFIQQPVASDPIDENGDGVYEVDIKGEDTDGNSVTYKAAYVIAIPYTAKSKLSDKTYYVDQGSNKYIEVKYSDTGFTEKYYVDTEPSGTVVNQAIAYDNDKFKFTNSEGEDITCTVGPNTPPSLKCSKGGSNTQETITYMSSAPAFVAPGSYTISSSNIENNDNAMAPQIKSFSITGTQASEDGQVIVNKSKLQGEFSINLELKDNIFVKSVQFGLEDSDESLILTGAFKNKTILTCTLDDLDSGIKYTCTAKGFAGIITLDNVDSNSDADLIAGACNVEDTTDEDRLCSYASVPVLFID